MNKKSTKKIAAGAPVTQADAVTKLMVNKAQVTINGRPATSEEIEQISSGEPTPTFKKLAELNDIYQFTFSARYVEARGVPQFIANALHPNTDELLRRHAEQAAHIKLIELIKNEEILLYDPYTHFQIDTKKFPEPHLGCLMSAEGFTKFASLFGIVMKYEPRSVVLPPELASSAENSTNRRKRLQSRIDAEKKKGNRGFNKSVAAEEGISVSRLKQLLGNKPKTSKPNQWGGLATSSRQTSQTKSKNKY